MNSSNWPENYDNFLDPSATTRMNDPQYGHAAQHSLANDALANIEHFLGATPNFNVFTSGGIPFGTSNPQDGNVITYNATSHIIEWQPRLYVIPYTKTGALPVTAGALRFPVFKSLQILGTIATVNTAPVGASIVLDILLNGTSIYTTTNNRPTIADGQFISQIPYPAPDITSAALGDYFQVNILQVGSSTSGSDLSVVIITQ